MASRQGATAARGSGRGGRAALALALVAALAGPGRAETIAVPAATPEIAIRLTDRGFAGPCAEMDNVLVELAHPEVRGFELRARHPHYAAAASAPSQAANFVGCVFPEEPIWEFELAEHLAYEDAAIKVMAYRLTRSWRPELVDVTVGDRVFPGIHMLQLFAKGPWGAHEVLVLHPHDGYWRARPLPRPGAVGPPYGASFLAGPVEVDRRHLVRLTGVRVVPEALRFEFGFAAGGGGSLTVTSIGQDETRLAIAFDRPTGQRPFALFSSMFVAPDNADVELIRLRAPGAAAWRNLPAIGFAPAEAAEVHFVRETVSRHNTLAPDTLIGPFRR